MAEMRAAFGASIDEVKLRRVEATPAQHVINFHLDHAHRTLGIPLNDSSEYEGSHLLYAIPGEGIVPAPRSRAGTAIVHDNSVPHGVTPLIRGVRYGLFLLHHGVQPL
jgi:predicted 2-oxoglutarate/Fe(II)-dependent dioxygenase YbiX